jgi:hypothetical protein
MSSTSGVASNVASKKVNEVVSEEDSESEAEEVHNETVNFMASKLSMVNGGITGETKLEILNNMIVIVY